MKVDHLSNGKKIRTEKESRDQNCGISDHIFHCLKSPLSKRTYIRLSCKIIQISENSVKTFFFKIGFSLERLFYLTFISHQDYFCHIKMILTLFDMGGGGGGHDSSQNVFDHCAQTLRRRKLKLSNF